jgi:putative CocE/NonD family hydrolase
MRRIFIALLLLSCFAVAQDDQKPQPPSNVDLIWAAKIPMRDGVHLNATIYKPHNEAQVEKLPAIFTLTPYISDSYHERAMYFAQHGYVFLLVDVRGRGNSEGTFDPFMQEPKDGHDVVEWIAQQPWCNGKVAMWGGSYAGFDQWLTLRERPPHLATIVPAAAAHAGVDFPMFKGIFGDYDMQWLTFTSGHTGQANLFGESPFWISKWRELYLEHLPFSQLDKLVGNPSQVFQTWIAHPTPDAHWQQLALTPDDYKSINVPILTITGDYDGDQPGAMTYYRNHMMYGSDQAKANHFLIIGPWDHAGTRSPKKEVGGLTFGDASVLDLNDLHRQWYDWTMKTGPKPAFLKKRVAYYVVAADEWKYADSLDSVSNSTQTLYLTSADGHPNDVFHAGTLAEAKSTNGSDAYVYDPLDVRFADLEKEDIKNYLTDQRYELNLYGDGLVYHSAPFAQPTEISGFVKLVAYIAMDTPDTDFNANLYEVQPDGASILLTSDALRARYRDSLSEAKFAKPAEINRYEFSGFTWFSRRIAKGSRLRLVFNSPNTIYQEKNYNSGGNVEQESGKDAHTAHITLYHDAEHASYLEIPIVK